MPYRDGLYLFGLDVQPDRLCFRAGS